MNSTKKLAFSISVLFTLIIINSLVIKFTNSSNEAQALSDRCETANRESCLTLEILSTANTHPKELDALFEQFSTLLKDGTLQDDPRIFSPIVHDLGMELAFKNIPIQEAFDYCPLNFKAGCLHGVVMEYIDILDFTDSNALLDFCDFTKDNKNYYQNCLHGLGHSLAAKNTGDLQSILEKCTFSSFSEVHACTTGVLMEFSTGVHGQGQHTHDSFPGAILLPCGELSSEYKATCYVALSNYRQYLPDTETFQETSQVCQNSPEEYQDECLLGLAEKIHTSTAGNLTESKAICESFNPALGTACKNALQKIDALDSVL